MEGIISRIKGAYGLIAKRKFAYILVAPTVIIFTAVSLYPLLYSLRLSFYSWNMLSPRLGQFFVGLDNYIKLIYDPMFWDSLKITFYFTGATVVLQFLIGLGLALLLDVKRAGRSIVAARTTILMPLLITPIVIGLMWRWLLNPEVGIVDYFLSLAGISAIQWLGNPSFALLSVIMVDVWHFTPFVALVLLAGLQTLSEELYDAARVDGATRLQMFRHVTIPLLKPVILVILLLRTMAAFRVFGKIFALTKGGPGRATEHLGLLVYRTGFMTFNMGYAAALSYAMVLFLLMIALLYIKLLPEPEA